MNKLLLICFISALSFGIHAAEPLKIVCTVPDLGSLVKQIGGDQVKVDSLARPSGNPHFISARPSFIRKVANADAFVVNGMDLEVGWAPALISSARNQRVRPGKDGYIDCSKAIKALEVPTSDFDRSAGDVHPHGNPHYMLSPVCAMQVVHHLGERLAVVDPNRADFFKQQAQKVQKSIAESLYGKEVAAAYKVVELIDWHLSNTLDEKIGDVQLGGWMADMKDLKGFAFIDDHKQWPYLADCFGFKIIAHLEPKAGVPPSTKHLQKIIGIAKESDAKAIITAPWFDPRHAKIVSNASNLPIIALGHQTASLKGTDTYQNLCAHNISALKSLLKAP